MTGQSAIRYRIAPKDPGAHLLEVSCEVPDPDPDGQTLSLPAWIPGSYLIRDFARHIVTLHARAGDRAVPVAKLDKQTWRCNPCPGPLTVEYEVYARDPSIRAAYLDTTRGFFNGTSVFVKVHGRETRPCVLDIEPPSHPDARRWRVATAMQPGGAAPWSFGRYRAGDYEELLDHPVEMGAFDIATFEACGVPHDVVVSGRHRADLERVCSDLETLCRQHIRFFGEPAPMARYVFLVRAVGEGYGGLEHRASCALLCPRKSLVRGAGPAMSKEYRGFLALCSHEYFHTWNVKRIRPRAFVPFDLSREVHTTLLWVFEGITSYYDDLALVRTGLVDAPSYLELLARVATRVWRNPGRRRQSVAESSFDAWTKFYREDENAPNAVVSYYAKGALIGLALDLSIRRGSGGRHSLDDVMRALWGRYGEGSDGLPEAGMAALIEEVTGLDLGSLLEQAVHGTEDLPLAGLLAHFGVAFELRAAQSQEDKGGPLPPDTPPAQARGALGVILGGAGTEARVAIVLDGGAAQAAGLAPDDVVVAVDGLRATRSDLEELVAGYPPGAQVPVHVFRGDELMRFDLTLGAAPQDTVMLTALEDVDSEVAARRDAWLKGL
ncbi:MAG: M61 family metallopeptidase [Gammaproteobacteria bacterium]|nr:M61 family metallopeptidase [Gammaproteobacteria bacterium]NIR82334.1 M61 family metallopeptidase [Gammaproteobacteria bacterium]NIR91833.1 M61 family metallopeptidase [Gammaproteobacteria bacterium]NIU03484.1 M61 family metallopeptidase [Gammaproteobacteria bacterium]NIV76886.1 PDZ domain-containing protein [Gammaproteobacteria bacterium]